jgi:hypothetical protein
LLAVKDLLAARLDAAAGGEELVLAAPQPDAPSRLASVTYVAGDRKLRKHDRVWVVPSDGKPRWAACIVATGVRPADNKIVAILVEDLLSRQLCGDDGVHAILPTVHMLQGAERNLADVLERLKTLAEDGRSQGRGRRS